VLAAVHHPVPYCMKVGEAPDLLNA